MSDEKFYTPDDVKQALQTRLVKFEAQLRDLHVRELRKDSHMEPGVHEAGQPGAEQHIEPGGHENAEMPMPQSPPEQPVGSSHGIPQGQLQDLCPMCGQPDMPGQCTCLNGGGNEGLMPPGPGLGTGDDMNPTQLGQQPALPQAQPQPTTTGLALSEDGVPMAMSEKPKWEKPWEKKCSAHGTAKCGQCGSMKKGADFIDKNGKPKMVGNHPDAVLPDDKAPKKIKSIDQPKVKKNGKGLSKDSELDKAYISPSTKHGISKPAGPVPPPKPVSAADHAADKKAAGLGKVSVPMAKPPGGGTGLAPKPPAMAKPVVPKIGAPGAAPKMGKRELSKSMGVCLFCGNGEHPGMCGLAKNIQTSLAKVAPPLIGVSGRHILQPQPQIKAAAAGLGHVATSPELGNIGPAGKTSIAPQQAGTVAGSPARQAKMPAMNFDALLHPAVPRRGQTVNAHLDSRGQPPIPKK